jgi:hypothetical protein
MFIGISISNKAPQTINEKENPWGCRLGMVTGGLNQQPNQLLHLKRRVVSKH